MVNYDFLTVSCSFSFFIDLLVTVNFTWLSESLQAGSTTLVCSHHEYIKISLKVITCNNVLVFSLFIWFLQYMQGDCFVINTKYCTNATFQIQWVVSGTYFFYSGVGGIVFSFWKVLVESQPQIVLGFSWGEWLVLQEGLMIFSLHCDTTPLY